MSEEYGRCKCGSIRFQSSSALPDNHVMCNQCHIVWEIEAGKLKSLKNTFTSQALDVIIAGARSLLLAYAPEERKQSLLDDILEDD